MPVTSIELLQRMPIFGAISGESLRFLLEQAGVVRVAAGEFFFRENDQADSMFVLQSGRAAVFKGWRGQEMLLYELKPGDCFGEMALMDLFPRSASVQAVLDCEAIEIRPQHLLRLFEQSPEQFALIQMNIGREVCRRLRATDEQLFRAKMGEAPATVPGAFRST